MAQQDEAFFFSLDEKRNFIWNKGDDFNFSYANHACPGRPWVIVNIPADNTNQINPLLGVLDVTNGKLVASLECEQEWDSGRATWLAWLPANGNDPPLLLVAGSKNLTAYSIKP